MSEPLLVEEHDDRVVVRLNRPEVRNAIDLATVEALHEACRSLEATPRVALLVGSGGTFAAGADIEYLAPCREGDVLIAEGEERSLGGRLGVYDITVRRQDGSTVALFRGRSYGLKGSVIEGQPMP